jgi:glycine/D-amino acid oxidase-like deaminating enzyme
MGADVLVVGAGPAGLATAIAASLQGLRAIVADSRRPPFDKTCGEGLLPEAVAALRSLGIELNSRLAFPLKGIRFADEESSACASLPGGTAFGLRRTALNASGSIDGIAGVGLSLVFQQAISLGQALAREDLNDYQSAHRRIANMPALMSRLLRLMDRSAWIRRKALRLFVESPWMFSALMSQHTGQRGAEALRPRELVDLGWRVLWA